MPDNSPEVRAAQRALGTYQPASDTTSTPSTIPVHGLASMAMDEVLSKLLEAEHVDIIGVFPSQYARRVNELHLQRGLSAPGQNRLPTVQYFTPARDRITLYRQRGLLGSLVQRWMSGITGLRNWLSPRSKDFSSPSILSIYEFDDMFLGCVILARSKEATWGVMLGELPIVTAPGEHGLTGISRIVPSVIAPAQLVELHNYLTTLADQSTPFVPRQIRCTIKDEGQSGPFVPIISRLAAYGRLVENDVEPVAVIAACTNTASGPSVLLKRRTSDNARDDFETLSLISERILLEDLLDGSYGPLDADQDRALDELWMRAGQPKRLELPEQSFRRAAQREIFICCGIDVHTDRLELLDSCVLDREGEGTYLGFYIYRLQLSRSAVHDEFREALSWNSNLVSVPFAELYGSQHRAKLNRLLRRRESWFKDTLFRATETG